jgi:hypothetical protein
MIRPLVFSSFVFFRDILSNFFSIGLYVVGFETSRLSRRRRKPMEMEPSKRDPESSELEAEPNSRRGSHRPKCVSSSQGRIIPFCQGTQSSRTHRHGTHVSMAVPLFLRHVTYYQMSLWSFCSYNIIWPYPYYYLSLWPFPYHYVLFGLSFLLFWNFLVRYLIKVGKKISEPSLVIHQKTHNFT